MFRDDASTEPVKHLYGVHDWSETWAAWVRDAGVTAWCATTHARDEVASDSGYREMRVVESGSNDRASARGQPDSTTRWYRVPYFTPVCSAHAFRHIVWPSCV